MNKTNIKLNHFFFCLITKAISEKKKLKIVLCQRCMWSWFLCAEGEKKTGRQKSKVVIWIIFLHDMSVSHLILYLCGIKKKKKDPQNKNETMSQLETWIINEFRDFYRNCQCIYLEKPLCRMYLPLACFGWSATWVQNVLGRGSVGTEFWSCWSAKLYTSRQTSGFTWGVGRHPSLSWLQVWRWVGKIDINYTKPLQIMTHNDSNKLSRN